MIENPFLKLNLNRNNLIHLIQTQLSRKFVDFFFQFDHHFFTANRQPPETGQFIEFLLDFLFSVFPVGDIQQPAQNSFLVIKSNGKIGDEKFPNFMIPVIADLPN